jgi:periplasmic divalent cation tolerance protein
MSTDVRVVFCSCPDQNIADSIAARLVEENLAACVNILPGCTSVYMWQGNLLKEPEHLLLIKTIERRLELLMRRVMELHPYDLPEMIALPVSSGWPAYLDWVRGGGGD